MKDRNKFYDVHFHTMDLSHANLTAFLERLELDIKSRSPLIAYIKMAYGAVKSKIRSLIYREKGFSFGNVRNLLSYMESSMEYDFHILEYFLKKKDPLFSRGVMELSGEEYDKMVLCPLIMDFGDKNIRDEEAFYNMPPIKPVVVQTTDLLNAVKHYFSYELKGNEESFDFVKSSTPKGKRLFEIYPFMGINTQNYSLRKTEEMMKKYFGKFSSGDSPSERRTKLFKAMGNFPGDLDDRRGCADLFAGIKVYPPLGFDPWPSDPEELKKVRFLYGFCIEKGVPVITHCSPGGFTAEPDWKTFTDPRRQWKCVLEQYPKLKLNFAHFGYDNREWQKTIAGYMKNPEYNVYADISCNPGSPRYYREIQRLVVEEGVPPKKILFGSDFMINLLNYRSYNDFLQTFGSTSELKDEIKRMMSGGNVEEFLFGQE